MSGEEERVLIRQFSVEFGALEGQPQLRLEMGPLDAWVLLGQLQLALRHPGNRGPSARIARGIAEQIQAEVATSPALAVVAERGWNSAFDEEPDDEVGAATLYLDDLAALLQVSRLADRVVRALHAKELGMQIGNEELGAAVEAAEPVLKRLARELQLPGEEGR